MMQEPTRIARNRLQALAILFNDWELDLIFILALGTFGLSVSTSLTASENSNCCERVDSATSVELKNENTIEIKLDEIEKQLKSLAAAGSRPTPSPSK
jgi:hypothetical protein